MADAARARTRLEGQINELTEQLRSETAARHDELSESCFYLTTGVSQIP